jgi:energy-converting hydrogenase A subunit M
MIDVISFLPAKRKQTTSGWISFNAPCCIHRGDTQDRRQRGGIKPGTDGSWSYHCFNCGYTASFVLGRTLTFKARCLLEWLNVPQEEIERINLESLKQKSIDGLLYERQAVVNQLQNIVFEDRDLPADTQELNESAMEYLQRRSIPLDYPFLYKTMPRPGIVIPFTYNNQVVGHTTRFLDDRTPRYIQDIQPGYVFGTDLQGTDWQSVIVVEGVFDALSINGLAVLHAEINDAQVRVIRNLARDVVVVPDQDEAGMRLVDRAVELGWAVSIPEWPAGVKDVNDAVIKLGKLGALLTIMQAKETSRIKIELRKKSLIKRLKQSKTVVF